MDAPHTSAPLPFADLLRLLVVDRETARLAVSDHEREGELYIANGKFVHASFGDLVGNDAVLEMLAAPSCEAEIEPGRITSTRTAIDDPHRLLDDQESLDEVDPTPLDEIDPASLDQVDPTPMPAPSPPWRSNTFGVVALVLAMAVAVALVWAAQIVRRNGETAADTETAGSPAAPPSTSSP